MRANVSILGFIASPLADVKRQGVSGTFETGKLTFTHEGLLKGLYDFTTGIILI